MPFSAVPVDEAKDSIFTKLPMDKIWTFLQLALIAGVGLLALRMLKPKPEPVPIDAGMTSLEAQKQAEEMRLLTERAADGDPDALQQLEHMAPSETALLDQEIALAQVDGRIKLSALKRIGSAIAASPPEAASVIRQWMNA
jgi:flagellar M-ring protein FliF